MKMYPDFQAISKTIEIGGLTKLQLTRKLQQQSISLNEYAERLFSNDKFTTSKTKYNLKTVELTIRNLGFPEGATMPQIFNRAEELGLDLCPLEVGPHLRLAYLNQPEGSTGNLPRGQAPSGSITIASEIISEDDDFPKGFYLRKINGVLWLRGYIAEDLHVWKTEDHFIFCQRKGY
ncbi:helicase [Sporosarcina thermotolerans]|uniref:Helicase n=1 Tax=Sporosarcina thermotolerans TaxID=633404 RepID=A0AAW9AAP2_9BACL|nr:helicase [Sporosarcina thermotolerans]MDW0118557.1 helicase [Sporosarcina thermotolerans]WHT49499.1 helicase [Sporosarcina thermotolerans]